MQHIYEAGQSQTTFLLLHGTGGNEQSLLQLAQLIDPTANVLSVRGNVLEQGMPRFFRRLAEGVFDFEDLALRTKELHEFIGEASERYHFDREHVVALGYSNGANIAANLLFTYENSVKGAILHHPMVPRRDATIPNLEGTAVFIAAGMNDPMCTKAESEELTELLTAAGATVETAWYHYGHQLTMDEVNDAKAWFTRTFL